MWDLHFFLIPPRLAWSRTENGTSLTSTLFNWFPEAVPRLSVAIQMALHRYMYMSTHVGRCSRRHLKNFLL